MAFTRVQPDDHERIRTVVDLQNAANRVDDPDAFPALPEALQGWLRHGWDLEPAEAHLFTPDGTDVPVGVLEIDMPQRDNHHLVWGSVLVHPEHRRQGHGSAMVDELRRRTAAAGRTTIWVEAVGSDAGARAFAEAHGFRYASSDARRRQVLAEVDRAEVDRLWTAARAASTDYELARLDSPVPDEVLADLAELTAVINDAPMGELTFEHEVFDAARMRDIETARVGRGDTFYRLVVRHRKTGRLAGHTLLGHVPFRPHLGFQGDTSVAREHRGHQLGLLLKIAMMRWLAEDAPQVEVVQTSNHVDNRHMIAINEALGYRLSQVFATYEHVLPTGS